MMTTIRQALARPWIPPDYGKLQYLWLLSLGYMFWKFAYVTPEPLELVLLALTIALFIPLYCLSFWARDWQVAACAAASCLIGVLWTPWNAGAASFFIFACAMCASLPTAPRAVGAMLAVIACGGAASFLAGPMQMVFLLPLLLIGLPVGLSTMMDVRMRASRRQLMRKQEEVEHMARIAERERISRDLHDLLGHSLSLIALKAELAGKLAPHDMRACAREIADIEAAARAALAEVRTAVSGYRDSGLAQALASARASLLAADVALDERVDQVALAPAAEHVVALAVREAVTNIIRHARASRCTLTLGREQHGGQARAVLRVLDDGRLRSTDELKPGNGLDGMQARAAALGGRLSLRAGAGAGTGAGLALELQVPLEAAA
jgi:two-component system sensor histidine kinase DesK